ncbi:hypothetical protein [Chryseobacterium sp. OSA05B]|uniref:hypothetical protein n=1 Tax=Chryseobacterium sp. OSA05B TaxID=2862650 RepID=UPI001CC0B14C|nr:hypothetical protein [Chryseobacterium sp. OSA05B]
MSDNFDDIKDIWLSADERVPDIDLVKEEISYLRKKKNTRFMRWYLSVIAFSLSVIAYVIYTDKLNSVYESISEFILLFTGSFLLYHSWKSIKIHKSEYLLSSQEFLQQMKDGSRNHDRKKIFVNCVSASLFTTALFLYFFKKLSVTQTLLTAGSLLFLIINVLIWTVIRAFYEKKSAEKATAFISAAEKLLKDINT